MISPFKKNRILHITPHLGGGVGRVLLNYLKKVRDDGQFTHEIACLDYANENAKKTADKEGITLSDNFFRNHAELLDKIAKADIVLIHWWNHPLLYDFLVRETLPPCRVIIWSHISGFNPPYIFTEPLFSYSDLLVFTTPVSFEAKEIRRLSENYKEKLRVVWSTSGTGHIADVKPKTHKDFNIGYIGTVDYCKLNPGFIEMCSQVDIAESHFIVCGGPMEKEIYSEAIECGIGQKFSFEGQVSDISGYLSIFDIFGYPLATYHYGTCEQSLAEAMAAGVPPVVLANKAESYMVEDGVTGIIANNGAEYAKAIKLLYKKANLRKELSIQAKEKALKHFSLDVMAAEWQKIFNHVINNIPKLPRKWTGKYNGKNTTYFEVFIESIGGYGDSFEKYKNAKNKHEKNIAKKKIEGIINSCYSWKSKTRGTACHYNTFFKDNFLEEISKMI